MTFPFLTFGLLLIACLMHVSHEEHAHDNRMPIISAPAGTFRGTIRTALNLLKYKAFLGIPYALPPIGELRFAKPQPQPVLKGVYDAEHFAPVCVQAAAPGPAGPGQEDCLYLNVFLPLETSEEHQLKKVFVYVHGGGFHIGSSTEHVPGDLVTQGDVIVVTLNYRLAWLGFLRGDHPSLPGNQAFWDQLQALNWVKQNIRAFGGDPDDLTIGGESVGAFSVSMLSISPHSKGLFNRVFAMSGSAFSVTPTRETSATQLETLTRRFGCNLGNTEDTVKCLKALPPEKFGRCIETVLESTFPTIDDDFLPGAPKDLLEDREYLKKIGFFSRDYMVRATNNEGAITLVGTFALDPIVNTTDLQIWSNLMNVPLPWLEKVFAWYEEPNHSTISPASDILGDLFLTIPTCKFAESIVAKDEEGKKTGSAHLLWYDFTPTYVPLPLTGFLHGLDVSYLFDRDVRESLYTYYFQRVQQGFEEVDWRVKYQLIDIVANFMKKGDPGASLKEQLNISWPPFDTDNEFYLSFEPEPTVRQYLLKDRRDFWKSLD